MQDLSVDEPVFDMVECVKPVANMDMALTSMPIFSGLGRADVKKRVGCRTDLAPIPSLSYKDDMKEKIRKKWTE